MLMVAVHIRMECRETNSYLDAHKDFMLCTIPQIGWHVVGHKVSSVRLNEQEPYVTCGTETEMVLPASSTRGFWKIWAKDLKRFGWHVTAVVDEDKFLKELTSWNPNPPQETKDGKYD